MDQSNNTHNDQKNNAKPKDEGSHYSTASPTLTASKKLLPSCTNNEIIKADTRLNSDLVWDDNNDDLNMNMNVNMNNNVMCCNEEEEDDDDDDDMSFKSAVTSSTNAYSTLNVGSANARTNNGMMYSSLEESFITYAHSSTILPSSSSVRMAKGRREHEYNAATESGTIMNSFDEISAASSSSSFDSGEFIDAICEEECDQDDNLQESSSNYGGIEETNEVTVDENQRMSNSSTTAIATNISTTGIQNTAEDATQMMQEHLLNNPTEKGSKVIMATASKPSASSSSSINSGTTSQRQRRRQQHHQLQRPKIQSFAFNQDKNCIAIATSAGYRIRTLPCSVLHQPAEQSSSISASKHGTVKVHQVAYPPISPVPSKPASQYQQQKSGTSHIQILHSTSVIAVVKASTPRILSVLHAKTAQCIKEIPFTNAIRRIEMNLLSLVVLTADGILHVFRLKGSVGNGGVGGGGHNGEKGIEFVKAIPILHESESPRMMTADSAKTTGAFFDLSNHLFSSTSASNNTTAANVDCSWLVTKSNEGVGYISVYKTSTKTMYCTSRAGRKASGKPTIQKVKKECMELIKTFQAHSHGITRVAIGGASDASLTQKVFATTSLKGTVIRVFSLPDCHKLYDFHRGTKPCTIFSLSFNVDASMLAVSSSRGTVHVFDVTEAAEMVRRAGLASNANPDNKEEAGSGGSRALRMVRSESSSSASSLKQRWYDGILSSMKKSSVDEESKPHIILRSVAKITCPKPVIPNTITILPKNSDVSPSSISEVERNENVAICFEDGKLLVYAIKPSRRMKVRPVLADDIMFDSDSALAS